MNCFQKEAQDLNSEIVKEQILSWSTLLSLHQEPYQHCVVGRSEQEQVRWQLKQCWETSWSIFGGLSKEEMIKAIFLDGQINMHIWYMEENDHLGYLYAYMLLIVWLEFSVVWLVWRVSLTVDDVVIAFCFWRLKIEEVIEKKLRLKLLDYCAHEHASYDLF